MIKTGISISKENYVKMYAKDLNGQWKNKSVLLGIKTKQNEQMVQILAFPNSNMTISYSISKVFSATELSIKMKSEKCI